ncbi:MAG: hypothetical protein ACPGVO_17635 [Spirulinaceae cyanobacterium]
MSISKSQSPSLGQFSNTKQEFHRLVDVSTYTKLNQYYQLPQDAGGKRNQHLPQYIERGGEQSFAPPYQSTNSELYLFALKADLQKLKDLCDQYLNPAHSAFEYRPIFGCVLLGFHRCEAMTPAQTNLSFAQDGEVVFWIPVWKRPKSGAAPPAGANPHQLPLLFTPYIFLNSSPALISGREALGYPKQWGWIDFPKGGNLEQGGDFKLETLVWQQKRGENLETVQGERDELLHISWASGLDWALSWLDSGWRTLHSSWQWWSETLNPFLAISPSARSSPAADSGLFGTATETVDAAIADITASLMAVMTPEDWDAEYVGQANPGKPCPKQLNALIRSFCQHSFVNVFLKQFRDVRETNHACYQAIVEAPCTSTQVHQIRLLKKHRLFNITLKNPQSHPIVEELGLAPIDPHDPEQSYTLQARWLTWLKFDFKLEPGEIIWESNLGQRSGDRPVHQPLVL